MALLDGGQNPTNETLCFYAAFDRARKAFLGYPAWRDVKEQL